MSNAIDNICSITGDVKLSTQEKFAYIIVFEHKMLFENLINTIDSWINQLDDPLIKDDYIRNISKTFKWD